MAVDRRQLYRPHRTGFNYKSGSLEVRPVKPALNCILTGRSFLRIRSIEIQTMNGHTSPGRHHKNSSREPIRFFVEKTESSGILCTNCAAFEYGQETNSFRVGIPRVAVRASNTHMVLPRDRTRSPGSGHYCSKVRSCARSAPVRRVLPVWCKKQYISALG